MTAKQRKFLSVGEKIEIIDTAEKFKLSIRQLSEKFAVSKTQVAEILKKKNDIRRNLAENGNLERKKAFSRRKTADLDKITYEWFTKVQQENIRISGRILKEKALEVATQLEIPSFKASNGWLEKFCQRWKITFKPISGEAGQVEIKDVTQWKEKLKKLIAGYSEEDIFNAQETGLFFRALPEKTLSLKGEKCTDGKSSKERLTILFCTSMTGEKMNPVVIGQSKNPRCFKGSHFEKLPLEWYFNHKSWMTRAIMSDWLTTFDRKMQRANRKVLLFLDNATWHATTVELQNVKVVFFFRRN